MTPDDLARLDRDLPSLKALDAEIDRRQGLIEMKMLRDGWGQKQGEIIHVSESQATGHEALGSAERVTDTKERIQRAARHLEARAKRRTQRDRLRRLLGTRLPIRARAHVPEGRILRRWLDNWTGIGHVTVGHG